MATITFDTHKFIRRLEAAGFQTEQAEVIAEAQKEVFAEALESTLATKADIETVRREILEAKADIIKWLAGLLIAQAAVVATLVKLL
jgi:hypothetical protein